MTMQVNIDGLFTCPLATNKFEDINNERIYEYCMYMYNNNPSNQRSNRNGWQSHHLQPHQSLDELVGKVKQVGETLFKFMKGKDEWKIELDNIWINVNTPGSYNTSHIHPRSFLSGVYYVKVPENSGKIHFDHPCQSFTYDWDGLYFNELIYKFIPKNEPLPLLFKLYKNQLIFMTNSDNYNLHMHLLRFEYLFLKEIGYEINLAYHNNYAIDDKVNYYYRFDTSIAEIAK